LVTLRVASTRRGEAGVPVVEEQRMALARGEAWTMRQSLMTPLATARISRATSRCGVFMYNGMI
jgi:hypothetical protein